MKSVVIIGLGYVGLPSAALIANAGYKVHGIDIDAELVTQLQRGECRLEEVEARDAVLKALSSGNLTVHTGPVEADIFIICVPTPVRADGSPELAMVASAVKSVAPYVKKGNLLILESTSPIGTTEKVIAKAMSERGLDPIKDINVCYCPERVFPGDTVREILDNDRVVGGLTPAAADRAKEFYLSFCNGEPLTCSAAEAEFSKLMENTYRDVNIALANVFSHIAEAADIDVSNVIKMANRHPRVNVHTPGPGVGGHCIPVDPWFLIHDYPVQAEFLKQARHINDGQVKHFLGKTESLGINSSDKVAILGAAYRGDIDDARDAPSGLLIDVLEENGYKYTVHDPYVSRLKTHDGHEVALGTDLNTVLEGASVAFIMTDHSVYKSLAPKDFASMSSKFIVDTRRMLDGKTFQDAGFKVVRVGAPTL